MSCHVHDRHELGFSFTFFYHALPLGLARRCSRGLFVFLSSVVWGLIGLFYLDFRLGWDTLGRLRDVSYRCTYPSS